MDLLKENECKFCHKKTKNGIRNHISQSKKCQKDYSEAEMQILKKWAKDKKNAKRKEKRKNDRNTLLNKNKCKSCHKKIENGIRKHLIQNKICLNDKNPDNLLKLAEENNKCWNSKKRAEHHKNVYDSDRRAKIHRKNYDPERRAELHRKSYDPEWRAELHRKNYDYNSRSDLHDKTYDPKKRSKLYDKFYEKKEAEKERIMKELNEKYRKAHFDNIDKHYEDKARKENIFDFKIAKDYFKIASHDINKMGNLSEEIRDKIKKIDTKIETNYKLYETKIDNAVAKNALGNKLIQDIYSEELFGEKCHYGLFEGWHDFKLQMDLEFINIAQMIKKVYPGTFVCTCFKCQDAKGAETIMKSSENQGLSTHTLGKKHMKYSYISSKERHKKKAKARGKKIM